MLEKSLLLIDDDQALTELLQEYLSAQGYTIHVASDGEAGLLAAKSGQHYDLIILDVPCSGSGVIRRHPEIPWNRTIKQLKKLVELQSQLLQNAWDLLKTDGTLIYSVCSIFSEEGDQQISKFVKQNKNAIKLQTNFIKPCAGDHPQLTSHENSYLGFDGFFYGLIKKNSI